MAHTQRLRGIANQMNRVADEARANAVAAEDVLAQIEDREARQRNRALAGSPAAVRR